MAPGKLNWEQKLTEDAGTFTLTLTPLAGTATWETVNKNGVQRGGRPVFAWLPRRINPDNVKITDGGSLNPMIADDFILVPLPSKTDGPIQVKFTVH